MRWFGRVKSENNADIVKKIGELRVERNRENVGRRRSGHWGRYEGMLCT